MSGRENRGLRGLAGKPFHPPLTDIPIAAYMFAAVFDILSFGISSGSHPELTRQLFVAGTWTLLGGVIVALGAALTGWADWHRSSEPGTQARRTINAHASIMLVATTVALIDLLIRLTASADRTDASFLLVVLSVVAAALVAVGATYGGGLVFDYGFNVETAGDHPVWHVTEVDVLPGQHSDSDAEADAVES
jgi:uncharacterized membrane protein